MNELAMPEWGEASTSLTTILLKAIDDDGIVLFKSPFGSAGESNYVLPYPSSSVSCDEYILGILWSNYR